MICSYILLLLSLNIDNTKSDIHFYQPIYQKMVQYQQNQSPINIQGLYQQSQTIQIMGNMNQVSIGDTNCILQILGNGNIVNIIHANLKIKLLGNGNIFNSIESKLSLNIQGNANTFKSQLQLQPIQLINCQGFGNQFPQNIIDKSQNNSKVMNVIGRGVIQKKNNISNYQTGKQPAQNLSHQNGYNIFNRNQQYNNQPNFIKSQNAVRQNTNRYNPYERMIDQNEQEQFPSFMNHQKEQQRQAQQQVRKAQQQAARAQQQARRAQRQAQIQAAKVQRQQVQQNKKRVQQQQQQARRIQQQQRQQLSRIMQNQQQYIRNQRNPFFINNNNNHRQYNNQSNQFPFLNDVFQNGDQNNLQFPQINDFFQLPNGFNNIYSRESNNGNRERQNNQRKNNNNNISSRQQQQLQNNNSNRRAQNESKNNQLPDHGLSQTQMQRLHTHSHSGPEQQCTICFLQISTNDQSMFLHCFHKFHSYCIQSWLKKSSKCPICSENVRKNF